jgi:hyperosmotically inducible periplasmic protein
MNARHVGLLTMLLVGCAHSQSQQHAEAPKNERTDEKVQEKRQVARENAAEEKRAEMAAEQRERSAEAYGTTPDNTRVNERDRDSSAVTPLDQSSSDRDVELTAQIRKAMIGDSSLSFTAKNTKIITRDGLVTLRGTVVNAREKETINKTAVSIAGKEHVVDELEIER